MRIDKRSKQIHFSRRSMLKGAGATAGTLAVGSMLKGTVGSILNPSPVKASTFWKGADVSWMQQMAANGYSWKNSSGEEENLFAILKTYGINAIRLRTWVNPSSDPVNGNCDQAQTIAQAVAAQAYGLPTDIDFHFGDTWNSVGAQNPPAAWANLSYSEMESTLGTYVFNFMKAMKSAGVTPGWVQLGNEINSGICHPVGGLNVPNQMTGLLMAGYNNVKDVFPNVPCIIHLAQPQDSGIEPFFNAYVQYGGKWDITGFSSYGSGSEVSGIVADMANYQAMYNHPVMQVEFGGPENNPSGTQSSLEGYISGVNDFGGMGVFYWEPEVYAPFDTYASGAWQTNGEPTTALNGFSDNTGTVITPYIQVGGGSWQQTATAAVSSTGTAVNLGPQPVSGGSWSWTGPNGYRSTSRQINNVPLTTSTEGYCLFVATYTSGSGVKSTQPFTIYVS
jgi:arabinogalactan endo-1,4-beta-galactosidase